MPRLFIGGIFTETNTFAPFPTGRADFALERCKDASRRDSHTCSEVLREFRTRAEAEGFEVVEGLSAFAQPAGPTVRSVYEELRDALLEDLRAAGAVDMVLLLLHGAMVAEGYDDCEAELLANIRAIVPGAVIGVELDPHCHLTAAMVRLADLIVIMKEYPHIDGQACAARLFELARDTLLGRISPQPVLIDTRMIGFFPTFAQPMRGIVDALKGEEEEGRILTGSIAHGFPWGDVAEAGTRVLAYADGNAEPAHAVAAETATRLYDARDTLLPDYPGVAASLDRAELLPGRVVIGEHSDNPGGGAPADATFFLAEMLARGVRDAAHGGLWDPGVAQICAGAGVGARLPVRVGGKTGPASGDPLDIVVDVQAVCEAHSQDAFGSRDQLGLSVWLRVEGIDLVVTSVRSQTYATDLFTGLGIDLASKRLIVVKSSRHFEHSFASLADHLWAAASPGALRTDFANFPYLHRDGLYHPRLADPWKSVGPPPTLLSGRSG